MLPSQPEQLNTEQLANDIRWRPADELHDALMTEKANGEYLLAYWQSGQIHLALAYSHGDKGINGNPEPPTFEVYSHHARVFLQDKKWFIDFGFKQPSRVTHFVYVDFSVFSR